MDPPQAPHGLRQRVLSATDFAHARGVLHRDLKPDNIMLGGLLARCTSSTGASNKVVEKDDDAPESHRAVTPDPATDDAPRTAFGTLMGTPGYMSPEQARRDDVVLDAHADVLRAWSDPVRAPGVRAAPRARIERRGAPLHAARRRRATVDARTMARRAAGARRGSASGRPPVDRADRCATLRARSTTPSKRSSPAIATSAPTVRTLAKDHARLATEATDRALRSGGDAVGERALAMREVSRAVALDPTNVDAMKALVRLFTEPPRELPPEASAGSLASPRSHAARRRARRGGRLRELAGLRAARLVDGRARASSGRALLRRCSSIAAAAAETVRGAREGVARDARRRIPAWALRVRPLAIAASVGVAGPFMFSPGHRRGEHDPLRVERGSVAARVGDRRGLSRRGGAVLSRARRRSAAVDRLRRGSRRHAPSGSCASRPSRRSCSSSSRTWQVIVTASIFVARFRDALHATQERVPLLPHLAAPSVRPQRSLRRGDAIDRAARALTRRHARRTNAANRRALSRASRSPPRS